VVIVIVINKTHSIIHGVFARCFDGVFGLFARSDPRWDPCILAPIRADPGTFSVAGIRIRANFGARIRSHLPAGPPGALRGARHLGSYSLKIMLLYHGRLNCNQLSRTQQPTLNIAPSLKLVKRLCICARSNVLYRVNLLWTQLYFMRTIEVL